jgi:hypothetical protein
MLEVDSRDQTRNASPEEPPLPPLPYSLDDKPFRERELGDLAMALNDALHEMSYAESRVWIETKIRSKRKLVDTTIFVYRGSPVVIHNLTIRFAPEHRAATDELARPLIGVPYNKSSLDRLRTALRAYCNGEITGSSKSEAGVMSMWFDCLTSP